MKKKATNRFLFRDEVRIRPVWWTEVDSNYRRREPADLQSAPIGRSGIRPNFDMLS